MTNTPTFRPLHAGMGQAVAERTILRTKANGVLENWGDVAERVALGNSLLCRDEVEQISERQALESHLRNGTILMSGRHLQHGDADQPTRNIDVFSNCASSVTSFAMIYLLLNGAGVGRSYDDNMMVVDWNNASNLRVVISEDHPDYDFSAHETVRDALHKYGPDGKHVMWFKVPDSREGWAKALEIWEISAFEKIHQNKTLILDFSGVREYGAPIGGMQNRPASGPVPLMNAFIKAASLKHTGLDPWKQAMYIDHYFAECVLVAGARRAARIATKYWKDANIIDFIEIKRPIEYSGMTADEVIAYRDKNPTTYGFLWSSNNSVLVDEEFWELLRLKRGTPKFMDPLAKRARKVWKRIIECSYADGTGEPGFINVDKLVRNDTGMDEMFKGDYIGYWKYQIKDSTQLLLSKLAKRAARAKYNMIVNPCGEIPLSVLCGLCVIADVVPYHADTIDDAEDAFRVAARSLIRTNTMGGLYTKEIRRTNRIGVGLTGVHEFAWKFFSVGFRELIAPDFDALAVEMQAGYSISDISSSENPAIRSAAFWLTINRFGRAVVDEADTYADRYGMVRPHTALTAKPSGTISKLFGLTEGIHLPPMQYYLRWVQFRNDDPLITQYKAEGYPTKTLKTYEGTTIVGFPTAPLIATLGMGDSLVTAGDATPEEQYTWLGLLEKFYLRGVDATTMELLEDDRGGQLSYTLKYKPDVVDIKTFAAMIMEHQPNVKACSVMPQTTSTSYEYLPEEPINKGEFEQLSRAIRHQLNEDIGEEHVLCESGACPVDFSKATKSDLVT